MLISIFPVRRSDSGSRVVGLSIFINLAEEIFFSSSSKVSVSRELESARD